MIRLLLGSFRHLRRGGDQLLLHQLRHPFQVFQVRGRQVVPLKRIGFEIEQLIALVAVLDVVADQLLVTILAGSEVAAPVRMREVYQEGLRIDRLFSGKGLPQTASVDMVPLGKLHRSQLQQRGKQIKDRSEGAVMNDILLDRIPHLQGCLLRRLRPRGDKRHAHPSLVVCSLLPTQGSR